MKSKKSKHNLTEDALHYLSTYSEIKGILSYMSAGDIFKAGYLAGRESPARKTDWVSGDHRSKKTYHEPRKSLKIKRK